MNFKFGSTKNRYSHESKSNNHDIGENPFEAIFQKINQNHFDRSYGNIEDNPNTLPANGHDICNYLARHRLANYQIQIVMKIDGILDYNKLVRAVQLSVDAEPVLGCRFVENETPYWKRLDNIDKIMFCSFEETDNPDKAIQSFLESPLDMDKDPVVKVRLIRSGPYDTLCIKLNHTCCDGAGTKEYIHLLSEIYSTINQECGIFIPRPRIGGRKDQDRLFSALGIKNPKAEWNPLEMIPRTMWTFPWRQGRTEATRFVVCRLPYGHVDVMSKYGKARGATINDLILTAYYRAMFEISKPLYGIPMDISSTIDLRRYLPNQKAEAMRNLSGGFITAIPRVKGESFEATLTRVIHQMNKVKDGRPGLQNAIGGELVEKMSFTKMNTYFKASSQVSEIAAQYPTPYSKLCLPGLSNLGLISRSLIKFGENAVTDAYIVPPAVRAPGFLLLACTYNGILTFVSGCYKDEISRKHMERLLNKVKDELMEGCGM
ncbi:MAG: condensation domain-containing protein [Bacillota bacterium]